MTGVPIDYQRPTPWRFWKPLRSLRILVPVLMVLAIAPLPWGGKAVTNWMDSATGTMRWETSWFGFVTDSRFDVSALEKRLVKLNARPAPNWRFIHTRQGGGYWCGTAPPIYSGRVCVDDFIATASDAEVLAFAKVLELGTDKEQQAAITALADKVLGDH